MAKRGDDIEQGSNLSRPVIDIRDPATIDLRRTRSGGRAPATGATATVTATATTEMTATEVELRLLALLETGSFHHQSVLDLLEESDVDRLGSAEAVNPRIARWIAVLSALAALAELTSPTKYIGVFQTRVDDVVRATLGFAPMDREAAALLLLDRTAFCASNRRDFIHGVRGATAIDGRSVTPHTVIDVVLRPCLRYSDRPGATSTVPYGLLVTLDVLSRGNGQSVNIDGTWALRAAIAKAPSSVRDQLGERAAKLPGQDGKILMRLLSPSEAPARRWFGRRG